MDKENGFFFVPDGFTPASTNFNGLQEEASRGFITILGFYMLFSRYKDQIIKSPRSSSKCPEKIVVFWGICVGDFFVWDDDMPAGMMPGWESSDELDAKN